MKKKINSISKKREPLEKSEHSKAEVDQVEENLGPEVQAVDLDAEAI